MKTMAVIGNRGNSQTDRLLYKIYNIHILLAICFAFAIVWSDFVTGPIISQKMAVFVVHFSDRVEQSVSYVRMFG